MMRHAFSLIELIFVIVLMGVLAGIGFYYSRPDPTRADAQYTLLKLKEARYRAIGYQTEGAECSDDGWVEFSETSLENDGRTPRHDIKSTILPDSAVLTNVQKTICFDHLGRPHDGNSTALSTLIHTKLDVIFKNGDKNTTIEVHPQTGYAIIPCKND